MLVDSLDLMDARINRRKNDLSRLKDQIKKEKMHR
jgi:hypothetical protein